MAMVDGAAMVLLLFDSSWWWSRCQKSLSSLVERWGGDCQWDSLQVEQIRKKASDAVAFAGVLVAASHHLDLDQEREQGVDSAHLHRCAPRYLSLS
ncbi:hypothetical protein GUJ93_ZPchr0004g39226 [Zizania palustris]|uniref:Uncharacterized protein n=1 Tax=Zizania palustris TaxID=103762 RepID=A0A8J5VYH6_ZIZPA|nr:hypothetical protein GUJ93_ZPchr0004g39226 [Zizania palustris]